MPVIMRNRHLAAVLALAVFGLAQAAAEPGAAQPGVKPDEKPAKSPPSASIDTAPPDFITNVTKGAGAIRKMAKYYVRRNDGVCVPAFGPIRALELLNKRKSDPERRELAALGVTPSSEGATTENFKLVEIDGNPTDDVSGHLVIFVSNHQELSTLGFTLATPNSALPSFNFTPNQSIEWEGGPLKMIDLRAGMLAQPGPDKSVDLRPIKSATPTPSELAWSIRQHKTPLLRFELVEYSKQPTKEVRVLRYGDWVTDLVPDGLMEFKIHWKRIEVPVAFDEKRLANINKGKTPENPPSGSSPSPNTQDSHSPK